jgi:hypothetical protein
MAYPVVWYAGTPYEMGVQQGQLLHEELRAGREWLDSTGLVDLILAIARATGLLAIAETNSYPDIVEECRGLTDAAGDVGWTMDICLLLNMGDMLVEFIQYGIPEATAAAPGCTQVIASGAATTDGRLLHARSLDWSRIEYLLDYPVIHVRQPAGGVPHVFIGFPGNLSPYSGMNAAGISIASDEADPADGSQHDRVGHSHVQMQAMMLKQVTSLDDARAFLVGEDHMTAEIIAVADGNAGRGAVFEMTARAVGVREMQDGVVWTTNHFVAPETQDADEDPASESSLKRFDRAAQLIPAGGAGSLYGTIDAASLVGFLRDRVDPWTGQPSPAGTFDDNSSIATNGAVYQIVFDPGNLCFWVAAGGVPVPEQPFVGFSLGELLQLPDARACAPAVFE